MEIVIKKLHAPWPNVRLTAGLLVNIEPDWIAEAIVARGFAWTKAAYDAQAEAGRVNAAKKAQDPKEVQTEPVEKVRKHRK